MNIARTCWKFHDRVWPRIALQRLFLFLVYGLAACAAPQVWEPARWERTTLAANQARERGNMAEAERLCMEALQYVDASAVKGLYEYASLLKALRRADAEAAQARAHKLQEFFSRPGSAYLGYKPSDELKRYAALLWEIGRGAEAETVLALAVAYDRGQMAHFFRLQEQARGGDPRGKC